MNFKTRLPSNLSNCQVVESWTQIDQDLPCPSLPCKTVRLQPNRTVVHQNQNSSKASWLLFLGYGEMDMSMDNFVKHVAETKWQVTRPPLKPQRLYIEMSSRSYAQTRLRRFERWHVVTNKSLASWMQAEMAGWEHRTRQQTSPEANRNPASQTQVWKQCNSSGEKFQKSRWNITKYKSIQLWMLQIKWTKIKWTQCPSCLARHAKDRKRMENRDFPI